MTTRLGKVKARYAVAILALAAGFTPAAGAAEAPASVASDSVEARTIVEKADLVRFPSESF
ncbi:MAG TPA: outer membrane lipoprotein-sorting protein, partial [Accumulibacter sp.]|nr:outer membrane lipoprotein-sorting protein [Accumulibacter sp.]